ncbi:MAG: hypothetical protein HQL65_14560 [Magnetococcales bacterium]|nr:hypothetical protein [Magnetococcales bacterium]
MIKRRSIQGERIKPSPKGMGSTNQEKPIFSLVHLQDAHALDKCTQAEKAAFADTLHRLSRLTWREIQSAPRHGLGSEIVPRDAIKAGIPSVITPDVRIIAFRCHGKALMLGFRDGVVFHVVWMDRDFTLYDHG